jgi:hypothetical protein
MLLLNSSNSLQQLIEILATFFPDLPSTLSHFIDQWVGMMFFFLVHTATPT